MDLKEFLLSKLYEAERMANCDLPTDTIRSWIDEYEDSIKSEHQTFYNLTAYTKWLLTSDSAISLHINNRSISQHIVGLMAHSIKEHINEIPLDVWNDTFKFKGIKYGVGGELIEDITYDIDWDGDVLLRINDDAIWMEDDEIYRFYSIVKDKLGKDTALDNLIKENRDIVINKMLKKLNIDHPRELIGRNIKLFDGGIYEVVKTYDDRPSVLLGRSMSDTELYNLNILDISELMLI